MYGKIRVDNNTCVIVSTGPSLIEFGFTHKVKKT